MLKPSIPPRKKEKSATFAVLFYSALFALLLLAAPAFAAPVKNATYPEFEALVKSSTAKIPDLKALWDWRGKFNEPVYFGGGALRGLMQWLEKNLQYHTLAEVQAMQVPTIAELLIQKDADRDLYHDRTGRAWFQANFPGTYGNWDILEKDFRDASVEAGGAGIEKIRVNPVEIDDPLQAVQAFYQGKLNYKDTPESTFSKFRATNSTLSNNYKSALVMRALRFANEIPSMEIDAATLKTMREAVASEKHLLKSGNYWIQKSLTKLRKSAQSDEQAMASLQKVGLDKDLGRLAYHLGAKELPVSSRQYIFLQTPAKDLSLRELQDFKVFSGALEANILAIRHMIPTIKTPEEFRQVFSTGVETATDEYKMALRGLLESNFTLFESLNPTQNDFKLLRKQGHYASTITGLMDLQMRRAGNIQEMMEALENEAPKVSAEYQTAFRLGGERALINKLPKLPEGTTVADLARLKGVAPTIDSAMAVIEKQLGLAKTADDILEAFKPVVATPTEAYLAKIAYVKALRINGLARALPKDTPIADFNKLKGLCVSIDCAMELTGEQFSRAKTAPEALTALESGFSNPHGDYVKRLTAFANEKLPGFARSLPEDSTAADFLLLKAKVPTINAGIAIMGEEIKRAKSVKDFVKALEPGLNANADYLKAIDALRDGSMLRFAKSLPDGTIMEEFNELKALSKSLPLSIQMTELQIERARSVKEFEKALLPGIANPNEAYLTQLNGLKAKHEASFANKPLEVEDSPGCWKKFAALLSP